MAYQKDKGGPRREGVPGGGKEYRGQSGSSQKYKGQGGGQGYRGQSGSQEHRGQGGGQQYRGQGGGQGYRGQSGGQQYRGQGGSQEYRGQGGSQEYRGQGGGQEYRGQGGGQGYRGQSDGGQQYKGQGGGQGYRGQSGGQEYRGQGGGQEYRGQGGGQGYRGQGGGQQYRGQSDGQQYRGQGGGQGYRGQSDGSQEYRGQSGGQGYRGQSGGQYHTRSERYPKNRMDSPEPTGAEPGRHYREKQPGEPFKGKAWQKGDINNREKTKGLSNQDSYLKQDGPVQDISSLPTQDDATQPYFLMGRNAVKEAVKSKRSIDRILVIPEQDGSLREIINMAREMGIVVRETDRKRLDELCMPFGHNGRPGNHQGILAFVPDIEYCTVEDILEHAKSLEQAPFLLILDEINDPHNLGSMLRSAACAGVHGIILPKRRAASITAAVAKVSAGAVEYVKVAKVTNLAVAMQQLKDAGIWIAGADQNGTPMQEVNLRGPLALVIGNEADGLSRLIREKCDYLAAIPMYGGVESLNASVAAAILMFEKKRQDASRA